MASNLSSFCLGLLTAETADTHTQKSHFLSHYAGRTVSNPICPIFVQEDVLLLGFVPFKLQVSSLQLLTLKTCLSLVMSVSRNSTGLSAECRYFLGGEDPQWRTGLLEQVRAGQLQGATHGGGQRRKAEVTQLYQQYSQPWWL